MSKIFKTLVPKPAERRQAPASGRASGQSVDQEKLEKAAREREGTAPADAGDKPKEIGGPEGPEPTRYGDWERGGICYDF